MFSGGPGAEAFGMTFAPPPAPSSADQAGSQQPPAPPVRPPLRRSATDRMLGGVCGGLADYSGIDPLLWRVGFVTVALMGPGIFVYLLLWVLMEPAPDIADADRAPLDRLATQLHERLSGRRTTP